MYSHLHGKLVSTTFASTCLKDNILGDPYERDVLVYLPPEYESSGRHYPTVTMLAGFGSTHYSVLGFSPWKKNTIEAFEAQIQNGECAPAILVLPDCMTRWGGSQFLDSPAMGRYQTYLADEVVPHIDATFRTIARREARAFVGRSSGGFGSLRLAMDRPDVVGAVASHAGDAAFDVSMRPMLTSAAIAIGQAGSLSAFIEKLDDGGPRGGFDFDAVFVLASSAAYAPQAQEALPHCGLPFDLRSAEIDPAAWRHWLDHDPLTRIPHAGKALREMSLIYLDAGDRDEHGLHFAARMLAEALQESGARVEHEEFGGGHRGTSYRYETSLPKVIAALEQD